MSRQSSSEPLAIVGIGCRFPGADSPDALWTVLRDGQDMLRDIPADRFSLEKHHDARPGTRGKVITRQGGFLEDIRGFDAPLFNISHREATRMDPQQRILLEVAWAALEDAGIPVEAVDGAAAGVFIGLFTNDYRDRLFSQARDLDVYAEIGTTRSSTSGRIAYAFNLTGPSVTVDAACASSLQAVHLAAQSIWSGETTMALAGGCNVILNPEASIAFSRSRMLSPDSRCKFGDASANGFVRSDGVGLVVLKSLADAQRDGDRVYAVLEASGCNNDARQGDGLFMTPSPDGQMALLRRLYGPGGADPSKLVYIEAHGTGTRAGDPVECSALDAVLTQGRATDRPLYVGSVKTNIGHTEGAAGIAGFIKATLALHHRVIPPSLHLKTPNPVLNLGRPGGLHIPTEAVPIGDEPALAGVNSFGLSGTNAHAVLGTFNNDSVAARPQSMYLLPLVAATPAALAARARQIQQVLRDTPEQVADLCYTLALRRSHRGVRLAVAGADSDSLAEGLNAHIEATESDLERPTARRIAFVFSGQGGQWAGMGRGLLQLAPAFAEEIDAVDAVVQAQEGWSIRAALTDVDSAWVGDIQRVQPLVFAVQVALAAQMEAYGIQPAMVIGHSMGEVAAAYVCGALDLEDAVRVICTRSRGLNAIAGEGAMAVVALDAAAAEAEIRHMADRVSVAVRNAAGSSVLSGDADVLDELLGGLETRGVDCRRVSVSVASHSHQTERVLPTLRRELAGLSPRESAVPFVSTVDAAERCGSRLDVEYWAANMRRPVRFAEACAVAMDDGCDAFIELNPHAILLHAIRQNARDRGATVASICPMRRDDDGLQTFFGSLAGLYEAGANLDWSRLTQPGRLVQLPVYPFQHESFWFEDDGDVRVAVGAQRTTRDGSAHPMLPVYCRVDSDAQRSVWQVPLSTAAFPYLADHQVFGAAIFPGAGFIELAQSAAREVLDGATIVVEDVQLSRYLEVPSKEPCTLQVELTVHGPQHASCRFYSFEPDDIEFRSPRQHATATVRSASGSALLAPVSHDVLDPMVEQINVEIDRRKNNAEHGAAVLTIDLVPGDPEAVPSSDPEIIRHVRELVRPEDLIFAGGPNRFQVLLRGVGTRAVVDRVVDRFNLLLPKRLREGGREDWRFALQCQLVEDDPAGAETRLAGTPIEGLTQQQSTPIPRMPAGAQRLDAGAFYRRADARNIHYGPAFQGLVEVTCADGVADARIETPADLELAGYQLHPATLDACFQACIALLGEDSGTWLPVHVHRFCVRRPSTSTLRVRAWRVDGGDDPLRVELDLLVTDDAGRVVLEVDGLRLQGFDAGSVGRAESVSQDWFYRFAWQPGAVHEGVARCLGLSGPVPDGALDAIAAYGHEVSADRDVEVIFIPNGGGAPGVRAAELGAGVVARIRDAGAGRMILITSGAQGPNGSAVSDPVAATIWGLARVAGNERTTLDLRLVDLDVDPGPRDLEVLAAVLGGGGDEREIAIRDGALWAHRLERAQPSQEANHLRRRLDEARPFAVRGSEEGPLVVVPASRSEVPTGTVEIRVDAASFQKRERWADVDLSGVCGVVVSVGANVIGLGIGQEVVALVPVVGGCTIQRFVQCPRVLVASRPFALTDDEAACLPLTHGVAELALTRVGRLEARQNVLIEDAGSPLGRACVGLARILGASVYALDGDPQARAELRAMNGVYALDSRAAGWSLQVRDLTGGDGVDLAVRHRGDSSLPEMIEALAVGGSLVDLSASAEGPAAGATAHNVIHARLDVSQLVRKRPEWVAGGLANAAARIERGSVFPPEPAEVVGVGEMDGAGEGLVVVELAHSGVIARHTDVELFEPDVAYLITGGTGGIGRALAAWMVDRGAQHLVLTSRRGGPAPVIDGAVVEVVRADVADAADVAQLISSFGDSRPALAGVFHLAGVLADGTLESQDQGRFETAMRPKVDGAWNLHQSTLELPLRQFVLFSSAATVLGSPGQANYAAANAYMDALAEQRWSMGRPGLSLNWGTWGEVGLAAASAERGARLANRGLKTMAPKDALAALGEVLAHDHGAAIGIFSMDWSAWRRSFRRYTEAPLVAHLVEVDEAPAGDAAESVLAADDASRPALMFTFLRSVVADVLGMPAGRVTASHSLPQLGLDSLMMVELRARISEQLQIEASPAVLLGAETLRALAKTLAARVEGETSAAAEKPAEMPSVELRSFPVVPRSEPLPSPEAVLVTGSTGFLGAHVVRKLLDQTRAKVFCLVRAENVRAGDARVAQCMARFDVWNPTDAERIEVLVGDLAAENLGLSDEGFATLGTSLDGIYHCGAMVNHVYSYAMLAPTNVAGTETVLRLAGLGPRCVVHHVSTLAVFPFTTSPDAVRQITETTPLDPVCEPYFEGYAQSKWAAEKLIEQARALGVRANIYRPGAIAGSTSAGICLTSDVVWLVAKACIETGQAPNLGRGVGLTPVDFVAEAIVSLALSAQGTDKTWHVFGAEPLSAGVMRAALALLGYAIEVVDVETWRATLKRHAGRGSALASVLPGLMSLDLEGLNQMKIEARSDATLEALSPVLRAKAEVTAALFTEYVAVLASRGFLPRPVEEQDEPLGVAQ